MKNTVLILAALVLSFLSVPSSWALEHNITAVAMRSPLTAGRYTVNTGRSVVVEFRNNGTSNDSNVIVTAVIRNPNNVVVYRDTEVVAMFESGQTLEVTFRDYTPTTLGSHQACGIAMTETDELLSDDTICSLMRVFYETDIIARSVLYPVPDSVISAKAGFKAKGVFESVGATDRFDIRARVRILKCSDNSLVFQADSIIPELIPDDGPVQFQFPSKQGAFDTRKLPAGCYTIALICNLPDDGDRTNDTARATFEIVNTTLPHDMKADSVVTPKNGTSIPNPTDIPITIRFRNTGSNDESNVKVTASVTNPKGVILYRDTATIDFLLKGGTQDISFKTFTFSSQSNYSGNYIFSGAVLLTNDEYRLDDTIRSSITLGTAQDVQAVEIIDPFKNEVKPGGVGFAVKVTFRTSWGTGEFLNVPVRVLIHECRDHLLRFQADTVIPVLNVDSGLFTVIFPVKSGIFNTASLPAGCYDVRAFHRLSFDGNRKNDTVKSAFTIAPFLSHNITAVAATAPLDQSHGGKLIAVAVKYKNTGVNDESTVKLLAIIKDRDSNVIYRDSAYESNWISSEERTKGFRNFTLPADGIYTLYGICSMTGDVSRSDDTVLSHFSTGQVIDAEAVAVVYPTQNENIIKGTLFNPIGTFRWAGGYDDKYPVPVSVEIRSCDDNMLVYQADSILDSLRIEDEEKEVVFPTTWDGWDIRNMPDGCYRVAVIATMEFDGNRKNDTAYSSILIIVKHSVEKEQAKEVLRLEANYPNPFHDKTTLQFHTTEDGYISLSLRDINGKLYRMELDNIYYGKGTNSIHINGITSGAYYCEILLRDSKGQTHKQSQLLIAK
ncbi:MAG TPA: T9SS type A sorting domain-containing protein [Candidatus Kapabacteria bacterium]